MAFVFFCPDLLSVIERFSKKNFGSSGDVVFLSFFELSQLFSGLDGDFKAKNLLLIHCVFNINFIVLEIKGT
jgi:hypothetical protein